MIYWIVTALTVLLYAVMVTWSLPIIADAAGGLIPFDMRPLGYGVDEAKVFLTALSDEGREFYLTIQHRLDLAYPAMLAFVLGAGGMGLTHARFRWVGCGTAFAAIVGTLADYSENRAVARLLKGDPELPSGYDIDIANISTLIKSGATTIAMTLCFALSLLWIAKQLRSRGAGP